MLCSKGTHYTVQFFLRVVGRALHAVTVGLHMVKQGTIDVCVTARNGLLTPVNTFKCRAMMGTVFCHKVTVILSGPGGWTGGPRWDHQDRLAC